MVLLAATIGAIALVVFVWVEYFNVLANLPDTAPGAAAAPAPDAARGMAAISSAMRAAVSSFLAPRTVRINSSNK